MAAAKTSLMMLRPGFPSLENALNAGPRLNLIALARKYHAISAFSTETIKFCLRSKARSGCFDKRLPWLPIAGSEFARLECPGQAQSLACRAADVQAIDHYGLDDTIRVDDESSA